MWYIKNYHFKSLEIKLMMVLQHSSVQKPFLKLNKYFYNYGFSN